jgi:hypothetical protein
MLKPFITFALAIASSALPAQPKGPKPVDAMNALFQSGRCSLKEEDWCAVRAESTDDSFTVFASSAKAIQILSFGYGNLTAPCFIWKSFGGVGGATAMLVVTDPSGARIFVSRICPK